jgi:Ca2+-transporting ATPase
MPSKLLVPCFSLCLNHLVLGPTATTSTPTGDYAVSLEQLASMTRDHNISALQEFGGASHL